MDGHGKNHLSDGWARDKSLIRWMGTGEIIYRMDGHGSYYLLNGRAGELLFIKWMGEG